MKKGRKPILIILLTVMVPALGLFYAYRHPRYDYSASGKLSSQPTLCAARPYFGLPIPEDIRDHWLEWAEALVAQNDRYAYQYSSFEADYDTVLEEGTTVITFTGNGIKEDGTQEKISDTIILPFRLYGLERS